LLKKNRPTHPTTATALALHLQTLYRTTLQEPTGRRLFAFDRRFLLQLPPLTP